MQLYKKMHIPNTAAMLPVSIRCDSSARYVDQDEECSLNYAVKRRNRPHKHATRRMTSPKDVSILNRQIDDCRTTNVPNTFQNERSKDKRLRQIFVPKTNKRTSKSNRRTSHRRMSVPKYAKLLHKKYAHISKRSSNSSTK